VNLDDPEEMNEPDNHIAPELKKWRELPITRGELYEVLFHIASDSYGEQRETIYQMARQVRGNGIMEVLNGNRVEAAGDLQGTALQTD